MPLNLELYADISSYQNGGPPRPIEFAKMQDAGIDGVCIRKSIGYYQDTQFVGNWNGAGEAGLKRTVYFVPFVGFNNDRQLAALTQGLDPALLDTPPWVDLERKHFLGLQAGANLAIWMLTKVSQWAHRRAVAYTGKYLWETYYSNKPGWIDDWDIVVANYGAGIPAMPIGWRFRMDGTPVPAMRAWRGWQYSADGNGLGRTFGCWSSAVDLSWQRL